MWKGCLFMLAVFGAALYLNVRFLEGHDLTDLWIVASVLSVGAMLVAGSIHGVLEASVKAIRPETDPGSWQDGRRIRVSGTVRAVGPARKAPFSGRDAIFCEWAMRRPGVSGDESNSSYPSFRGLEGSGCLLYLPQCAVKLTGFPNLEKFPEERFYPANVENLVARLVTSRQWQIPKASVGAIYRFEDALAPDKGPVQLNVLNKQAYNDIVAPKGEPSVASVAGKDAARLEGARAETILRERLGQQRWKYSERLVEPETEVTVEGTYAAHPPRIDISFGLGKTHHTIRPGSASGTASKDLLWSLVFTTVLSAAVVGAHYVVHADQGTRYRLLVDWVSSLG